MGFYFNDYYMNNNDSKLYVMTENGLVPVSELSNPNMPINFMKPVSIVFPKADPRWYYEGYPGTVLAGDTVGDLIDYIPVSFYAVKDEKLYVAFHPNENYVGYLNTEKELVSDLLINGVEYKRGEYVFTILLSKNAPQAVGSRLYNTSYWTLLSEVSNIHPGQTIQKSVSISSGVSTLEGKILSVAVGSKAGLKIGFSGSAISAELSASLSRSLLRYVTISTKFTVTDVINFPAQPKPQRAALYQFSERFKIIPGNAIYKWRDYLNSKVDDNAKFYSSRFVSRIELPPFDYLSRYFATSFVVEPD
ncbi:hypothetical protein PV797_01585 [Clostridiaceae bacterium M8S5]|nr:hypothetical protein PV797_01585 [Clostridiaceae bacterium M8S5]